MGRKDLSGRTWVVTGANTGIGRVTAETLAARGAHVVLACRSLPKTQPVLDSIRTAGGSAEFLAIDLADLASAKRAATTLRERGTPIHGLVNNAGLAATGGLTAQGFEMTFGVNHLGAFVFTENLLGTLVSSAPARIVFVASKAHYRVRTIDWDHLREPARTPMGFPEYCVSKLCNVLYSNELARRLVDRDVSTYSLHPGVVASDVWREVPAPFRGIAKLFMLSNEDGAKTTLFCAADETTAHETGHYYDRCRIVRPSALANDVALQDLLVAKSRAFAASYLDDGPRNGG